jgi:DNA repair exonuclease SbcCD ATPase subunit
MTTTPITPERPPPEFNNWTEVWDEHQLRGTQLRTAATTIASLRAENERLKETSDICPVCGPDAKGCSHIQPRRLLLAEIDRLRTLLAAAQAECEELNKLALVAETALAEFDELVRDNTISEADYAHVIPPLRSGVDAARRKVQG